MIPKQAIDKAIQAGWKDTFLKQMSVASWQVAALDPSFWQALGKALGWNSEECRGLSDDRFVQEWHANALYFYDLILTGQPTEQFWAELLK